MEAGRIVKEEGGDNPLLQMIADDPMFRTSLEELEKAMDPARYVGRAPYQTEKYLREVVEPMLSANAGLLGYQAVINV